MVYMQPIIDFVHNEVLKKQDLDRDETQLRYVIIYTMCYILAKMIDKSLELYLNHCNAEEKRIPILKMKNEYLFKRMLITTNKKNYASVIEFKEGKPMNETVDLKGIAIHKSSTNRNASAIFKDILERDILKCKGSPNVIEIVEELEEFEKEIRRSLQAGESTYLKPTNVNDPMAYVDPISNQGFRGAMVWNALNPEKEINFPDSFFLVKTKLTRPDDLKQIDDENIREILMETIFNSNEKRIKSKGVYIVAIPRDEEIPDWLRPFIDEEQIVEDTMKAFLPIMNALGMQTIYTESKAKKISNYIEL